MTEQTTQGTPLLPSKPFYGIEKGEGRANLIDPTHKKIMIIENCDQCRFVKSGTEVGGAIINGPDSEQTEEDIWYWCFHPTYSGWPHRIGQSKDTVKCPGGGTIICPLDNLVKINDDLIEEKARKERKPRTQRSGSTESDSEDHQGQDRETN